MKPFQRLYLVLLVLLFLATGFAPLTARAAPPPAPRPAMLYQSGSSVAQHSVTLSWAASSDASSTNPVTYNVLRANGVCGTSGQTFTLLSAGAGLSATTFKDTTVLGGQTYAYEVEAVGQNGAVSGPSNCAVGAVPPFPPGTLAVTGTQ
jgi:hypothetical protein